MIKKLEIEGQNFWGGLTPAQWYEIYATINKLIERVRELEDRLGDE
jgi:hypothetical protein